MCVCVILLSRYEGGGESVYGVWCVLCVPKRTRTLGGPSFFGGALHHHHHIVGAPTHTHWERERLPTREAVRHATSVR